MAYSSDSIKNIVLDISSNKYLLPAIQREVVWDYEQIEKLFDSILSGYPIGSMLFWKYLRIENCDYKFYEFLKEYNEYDKSKQHNPTHDMGGKKDIVAVLDGQQRLTALYLGLKGHLYLHKPRTQWGKKENFEKKQLYINVFYNKDNQDEDATYNYEFKFKTVEDVKKENENNRNFWFKVGDILDFENKRHHRVKYSNVYNEFSQELKDLVDDTFADLYKYFVEDSTINFFEEDTKSFNRVLQIFVRINSGGTPLDYTDLLMSMITNQWGEGRNRINDSLDAINQECNFNIPKDIFLRGCLFMTDLPLVFNVDNFKQENILTIESSFCEIVKYIKASCNIFNELGYSKDNLRSNLIILPLALFLYQNKSLDLNVSDKKRVQKWIQLSIINKVFGSQTTSYLTKLRKIIKNKIEFPLNDIMQESKLMGRSMDISEEVLEDLIENSKYGTQNSWVLLTLLYPNLAFEDKIFHEDHIYPSSKLTKEQLENGGNYIANLQLLEGKKNIKKQDKKPEEWIIEYCNERNIEINKYKNENYIPLIELSDENFDIYIQKRKKIIAKNILSKFC